MKVKEQQAMSEMRSLTYIDERIKETLYRIIIIVWL